MIKGCINEECIANKKKMKYKKDDVYCPKCGSKLVHVCKKCYRPIEGDKKLCMRCEAGNKDMISNIKKVVGAAGALALTRVPGIFKKK